MSAIVTVATNRTKLATYTATFSSLTNATAVTKWYRDGQFLYIEGLVTWTGAGGAGAFTVALPTTDAGNPLIDTTALPGGANTANGTVSQVGGLCTWFDQGAGWAWVSPKFVNTTTVGFVMNTQILDGSQFANGDGFNFSIKVPVVGW